MISENPPSRHRNIGRGSCRSALADGVARRSTAVVPGTRGLSVHSRRRPNGSLRPVNRSPPHPPLQSASEGIGGARGLGNLVRPESHPEPRGFPVQWADVEDHRLTRADGRQKVSLTVVLGMILRLIGTNPPQEPLSAVFWLWKLS